MRVLFFVFPAVEAFFKMHLSALYSGASSCTVKGSRYHGSLGAMMRGVPMHLRYSSDWEKCV